MNNQPDSPVFFDKKLDEHFRKYGYVVTDFLSPDAVDGLRNFYFTTENPVEGAFHTTHFATDKEYKQKVHDTIVNFLGPKVQETLIDYTPVFGNFMIKEGGGNNPMPLHADWTYVDETVSTSLAIWIPLVDTNVENGCLGVIPFSQHLSNNIRGPRILQWEYPCNEKLINAMGRLLPLNAGQAVIYNHRLLHYSPPNETLQVRQALNLSLVPAHAEMIHYTIPEGTDELHKFSVNKPDFFIHYDNFQMPERGKLLEKKEILIPLIDNSADKFISSHTKQPFWKKVKAALQI